LLITFMFGSFVIILGIMIAIFRPEPVVRTPAKARAREQVLVMLSDTTAQQATQKDSIRPKEEDRIAKKTKAKPVSPQTSPTTNASSKVYHQLRQEQKEMAQLRIDLEKRLNAALKDHSQKLKQLARRCEPLEPGEAVQILLPLSDADIATVLGHMQPARAIPVIALLKRNGRDKAIAKIK